MNGGRAGGAFEASPPGKGSLYLKSARRQNQIYYLEALENADFDRFPREVYLKGALTNTQQWWGWNPKGSRLYRNLGRKAPGKSKAAAKRKLFRYRVRKGLLR